MKRTLAILLAVLLLVGFTAPVFADDNGDCSDVFATIRKYIASWIAWFAAQTDDGKPDPTEVTKPIK